MITKHIQNPYTKQTRNLLLGVGLVFCLVWVSCFLPSEAKAESASLFLTPASQSLETGERFSMEVKVDTGSIPINAGQAIIHFPYDTLEIVSISKENSIFSFWPEEPVFSNSTGEISFVGGLPTPGFTGIGNLITVEFKARQLGVSNLTFGDARVLADDGKGTNVLVYLKSAKYFILEKITLPGKEPEAALPQIFSLTHPQEDEWYNNNSPSFKWNLTPGITDVSFDLNQKPEAMPDTVSEGRKEFKKYEKVLDGIWYFHLSPKNETGWLEPVHYKIQIDTTPPNLFELVIDNAGDPTNPKPSLYFETSDAASGIKNYKLKIGQGDFSNLMLAQINPVFLSLQDPGSRKIIVRAVDKAGNSVQAESFINIESIESPEINVWPKKYIAGEEVFYIEGKSLPNAEITIFLKKDNKEIRKWQAISNNQGEWSFSTREFLKSGNYSLSALAQDNRGAISDFSDAKEIEIFFSGLFFGSLMVSFKTLVLSLFLVLCLGIIIFAYFFYKNRLAKRVLIKETCEAREILKENFDSLGKEIEKRIEMADNQPGFSEAEKDVCENIKKALKTTKKKIEKEIKDIERELK